MAYPVAGISTNFAGAATDAVDYRNLFKVAYADMIRLKIQQSVSQLQDCCIQERIAGDPLNIDSWKKISLQARTMNQRLGGEVGNQAFGQTLSDRRPLVPEFREYPELFDRRHERAWMRALRPDSQYALNVMAAYNRFKDEKIIVGLDDTVAQTGAQSTADSALTTGTAGNVLWYNDTRRTSSLGMDLDDILVANRMLQVAGGVGMRKFAAVSPYALEDLLGSGTITSADYNSVRTLMTGEMDQFMGFTWKTTPLIGTTNSESGSTVHIGKGLNGATVVKFNSGSATSAAGYQGYFFVDGSMTFGQGDMYVRFSEESTFGFGLQAYHDLGVGAVRTDDTAVVVVQHR